MHNPVIANNIGLYNRRITDKESPILEAYFECGIRSGGQSLDIVQLGRVSDKTGDDVLLERVRGAIRCTGEYVVGIGEERGGRLIYCVQQTSRREGSFEFLVAEEVDGG